MIIDTAEFTPKELFFVIQTIITLLKYYRFHDKNFFGNHKCTANNYIMWMGWFYPYPSGLFHWHWGNHKIALWFSVCE